MCMVKELYLKDLYYSPDIVNLYTLTNGVGGYMGFYIQTIWNAYQQDKLDYYCRIFAFYDGDTIIGWALLQDLLYRNGDYVELSIYVNPKNRGNGIGSDLMQYISKKVVDKKISVWYKGQTLFKRFATHPFYPFDMKHYEKTKEYKLL
jgi:GNAT superfamily N-acetyltransferase